MESADQKFFPHYDHLKPWGTPWVHMDDWKTETLHLFYPLWHREPMPKPIANPGSGGLAHNYSQSHLFFPSLVSKVWLFIPSALAFLQLDQPLSLTIPACTVMAIFPPQHARTQSQWVWYLKPPTPAIFPTLRFSSMDSHGRLTLCLLISASLTHIKALEMQESTFQTTGTKNTKSYSSTCRPSHSLSMEMWFSSQ